MFLAQLAAVAGTLALTKIVASVARAEEFGRFALLLACAAALNTLLLGPLTGSAARHYQEAKEAGALRAYFVSLVRVLLIWTSAGSAVAVIVALLFPAAIAELHLSRSLVLVGVAVGIVMASTDLLVVIANASLRRRLAAVFLLASSWGRAAGAAAAAALGADSAIRFAYGVLGALVLVLMGQLALYARLETTAGAAWAGPGGHAGFDRRLASYALPLVIWGVPGYVLAFGDRLLLSYFTDPATVGVYAAMAAASVGVTNALGTAANRGLEPALYAEAGAATDAGRTSTALTLLRRVTLLMALTSLPLIGVYALWPQQIIELFTSATYAGEAQLLVPLLAAGIVFTLGQQLMLHGLVVKRPWAYVPTKFAHAGVVLAGIAYAVPRHGLSGLVWSLLVAHVVQFLLVVLVNRFRFPAAAGTGRGRVSEA